MINLHCIMQKKKRKNPNVLFALNSNTENIKAYIDNLQ